MTLEQWRVYLAQKHPAKQCPCRKRCRYVADVVAKDPRRTDKLRKRILRMSALADACTRCGRTPFLTRGPCVRCMSPAEEALGLAMALL